MFEKVIGTLAGDSPDTRVELAQVAEPGEQPTLEIRLLHDAGALGWTVQKTIRLGAGQVPDLRDALNLLDADARAPRRPDVGHLRIVPDFDEAL